MIAIRAIPLVGGSVSPAAMGRACHRGRPALGLAVIWAGVSLLAVGAVRSARAQERILIGGTDEWRYVGGEEEPEPDWTAVDFDDRTWLRGFAGIGYGDGDDTTVIEDMQGNYVSVYFRCPFVVEDFESIKRLALSISYDDGFVAYINGIEVARAGLFGVPPLFDELATGHEAGVFEDFDLDSFIGLLQDENVLAVQVHNTGLHSSDLSFQSVLKANSARCPTDFACAFNAADRSVVLEWTNRATYDRFEVFRDGNLIAAAVSGEAESYADLSAPPTEVTYELVAIDIGRPCAPLACTTAAVPAEDILIAPGDEWTYFPGRTDPPPGWTELEFDDAGWLRGPTGIGYGDDDDRTVLEDMQDNYLAVFCRRAFRVDDLSESHQFQLSTVYDDGVVVYLNGRELERFNVAPGPAGAAVGAIAAVEFSRFERNLAKSLLREGDNMLACSVHNKGVTSSDLSFIPTLVRVPLDRSVLFRRGDFNQDRVINLSDAVGLLGALFRAEPESNCPDSADVNDDGMINLSDSIYLLQVLFRGADEPRPRGFPGCASDPTPDALSQCLGSGC